MASYDVASNIGQALADIARQVIETHSEIAFEPSFLESSGII